MEEDRHQEDQKEGHLRRFSRLWCRMRRRQHPASVWRTRGIVSRCRIGCWSSTYPELPSKEDRRVGAGHFILLNFEVCNTSLATALH